MDRDVHARPLGTLVPGGPRRHLADLLAFKCLDVIQAIDDAAAELDEARAFSRVPPALECARRHPPAFGKIDLREVREQHVLSPCCIERAPRMTGPLCAVVGMDVESVWDACGMERIFAVGWVWDLWDAHPTPYF